jgi:hypothetical protein
MKNSNETIGNRSRDLPVCNAVPQPLCHRRPHPPSPRAKYRSIFNVLRTNILFVTVGRCALLPFCCGSLHRNVVNVHCSNTRP